MHLCLLAACPACPFQADGQFLRIGGRLLGNRGEDGDSGGELFGRLLEALIGGDAALVRLLRLGGRLRQLAHAEAAVGEAEMIEHRSVVGKLLVRSQRLKLLDGAGVIFVRQCQERQRQTVAHCGDFFVVAELAQELAETRDGKWIILLVVRLPGAREEHLGLLFRSHLCERRRTPQQQSDGRQYPRPADGIGTGNDHHPLALQQKSGELERV